MKILKSLILVILLLTTTVLIAQKPKPIVKFKQPKLTISIGSYSDTAKINVDAVAATIALPLKVVNAKNENYNIISYHILYKKNVVSEDEQTGKPFNTTSIKSAFFKTTPLSSLWIDALQENPKAGEEIIFFDVIVKDKEGRIMYAPNLKLTIQ